MTSAVLSVGRAARNAITEGTAPMIRVNAVSKKFPVRKGWGELLRHPIARNYVTVLNAVTLDIAQGEFFGLLGQNGAGKTTLFRILSTLILPDSGSVTVSGMDVVDRASDIRALVAPVIASERSLHWRLDARENLRLFAILQQLPASEVNDAIEQVLGVVSLTDTAQKLVGTFSSGMRQRLLIARALLGKPRVLLLDEPTRSLDPIAARDFRVFLRDTIVGEQGCTVLLATHDADDVWSLCDRVGVLDRGELLALDKTTSLRAHVGDEEYRLWLRHGDAVRHREFARRNGLTVIRTSEATDREWLEVTIEIPGGSDRVAAYLTDLTSGGIPVARCEKRTLDLADVIERVVRARGVSR